MIYYIHTHTQTQTQTQTQITDRNAHTMPTHDVFFQILGLISVLVFFLCALCDYLQISFVSLFMGGLFGLCIYLLIVYIYIKLSYIKK